MYRLTTLYIFLLTDGKIHDHQELIELVSQHINPTNKFYMIGIGNDVDRDLLNQIAKVIAIVISYFAAKQYRADVCNRGRQIGN